MKVSKQQQKNRQLIYACFILLLCCLHSPVRAFSPYSNRELEELEKSFIQQINQSDSVLRHPLAIQYINHLGKRLARFSEMSTPYFFIVKSNEINAFAGPGGYIGLNSQLILSSENESELAAVMAHEMAHVRLHHLYRMIEHQKQMRIPMLASILASVALGIINPTLGSGALLASMTGLNQNAINFTRSNEKEADRIGIDMLIKSGFNPQGMAAFFKKMQLNSRYYYTSDMPAILRTHPLDEDRIAEAENRSLHIKKRLYPDNLSYHLFKELVRASVGEDKLLLDFYKYQCKNQEIEQACQYGHALTLLNINQYQKAQELCLALTKKNPQNVYYVLALASAQLGLKDYSQAIAELKKLYQTYPEDYAILMAYSHSLMMNNNTDKAVSILLKGNRIFKEDLPLCNQLAHAYAQNQRKDYAYFTRAHCQLLQGRKKQAIQQLKQAQRFLKNDRLLAARIQAKIDEIRSR